MNSKELLQKYISFYEERGHKLIPNVSLVPENDPTLLFVNSGMFPLVPYLSGQPHPEGKRLVNVQRSLRFEDMESIGDKSHTIAFHMIGNWSLGDYFKKEQLPWVYEFLVEVLGLDVNKLFSTVFAGDADAPKDTESIEILKQVFLKYGLDAREGERIFPYGKESNWWKRGDAVGELGGPDSEVFYYLGEGSGLGKNPKDHEEEFLEIGNSVFMQYKKTESGWEELAQKNVDFGGGLERLAWVVQGKKDIFETDNFWPIIEKVQEISGKVYGQNADETRSMRILSDHMRGAVLLAMDGVTPSNKDQGYVLRRLLRRMTRAGKILGVDSDLSVNLVSSVVQAIGWLYPQIAEKQKQIETIFSQEESKFRQTLERGSKTFEKMSAHLISEAESGNWEYVVNQAFDLYQSLGYPAETFVEDLKDRGVNVDEQKFIHDFNEVFKLHQDSSRAGAENKFKGGLADNSEEVVKYHTATHLLHQALRSVLGEHVQQQGSNITGERLRFDFSHGEKLSEVEIEKIKSIVNEKINQKISVNKVILSREDAEKTGALHFFGEKYGDTVSVYYVGENIENAFSKEFCGGPHVSNTGELGNLEIYKQESIGKGKMRIYARFV